MQLMIDTADSPELLRLASKFLDDAARLGKVVAPRIVDVPAPSVPSGTVETPPAPSIPSPPAATVPPPPPAPTTPAAPAADTTETTAAPTGTSASSGATVDPNAQLDKRGFPFDERIHSGKAPGTINKSDGLWRTRRGVDNALIESVEAELKAIGYGVAVPPAPLTPPAGAVPPPPPNVPPPPAGAVPPPPASSVPLPPGATDSGGAGSVPAGNQVDPFRELMNAVSGHTGPDGKLRREIMGPIYSRILNKEGAGLPDFHKARDKIPEVLVEVRRILAA
jgi:hypothetical protein